MELTVRPVRRVRTAATDRLASPYRCDSRGLTCEWPLPRTRSRRRARRGRRKCPSPCERAGVPRRGGRLLARGRRRRRLVVVALKVRYWGTRGSIPTPAREMAAYGGNTPCVELTLSDGSEVILDGGTGIRELGRALPRLRIRACPPHPPSSRPHSRLDVLRAPVRSTQRRSHLGAAGARRSIVGVLLNDRG